MNNNFITKLVRKKDELLRELSKIQQEVSQYESYALDVLSSNQNVSEDRDTLCILDMMEKRLDELNKRAAEIHKEMTEIAKQMKSLSDLYDFRLN